MIGLAKPVIGPEEEAAVLEVLRSGRLSLGPKLTEFEERFAARLGDGLYASAVSSGTAGLHLALRALDVGEGDEVVTSPFSFVASANAVLYCGARPVFADIDPVTFNLDPEAARAALTERTRAIEPVHIFGIPADTPAFEKLGLPLVEDTCESLGAVHADGVPSGGRGHLSVFAFYANQQLTTGEGGMVITHDPELKARIDSERNQGRAPDMGWLDHDRLGFNYRLSDLACALGLAQLDRLDAMLAGRARVADLYAEALGGLPVTLPPEISGRSLFVYVVQVEPGIDRDGVIRAMREREVDCKPYMPPIHLFSFYRERFGHREGEFPVAEDVGARSLALPFHPELTESEVAQVAEALAASLRVPVR